ncbi:MAG TPA: Omp28-related outer membrane protein [Flavobacteriia bacterium]|nr:Omp28-related outer membrane protein [Flavobacteriia bacterium]
MPLNMKNISITFLYIILFVFINSCNIDDFSKISEIHIEASSLNVLVNQEILLTSKANNNQDITGETVFYVDDIPLQDNHFYASQNGIFSIKGVYKGLESNVLEIKVSSSTGYTQKVLVEDYTGVWCGYCPRVAYAIQQVEENQDYNHKMVPVAIHLYDNNDPFYCEDGGALKDFFNISGLPQGRINKTIIWTGPQHDNLDAVYNVIGGDAALGIAIDSSLDDHTIHANIRIGFAQNFDNLGLVIYLLEDGLIHNQVNYTELFGGEATLINFVHNDVLRKVYTDILGEEITNQESVIDNIYSYNLQELLPNTIQNTNNLKLVVFVVDKTTNTAINVQSVKVGENQSFD